MLITLIDLCPYCYSPCITYDTAGVEARGIKQDGTLLEYINYAEEAFCHQCYNRASPAPTVVGLNADGKWLYGVADLSNGFVIVSISVTQDRSGNILFCGDTLPQLVARLEDNEITRGIYEELFEGVIGVDRPQDVLYSLLNTLLGMAGMSSTLLMGGIKS